MSKKELQTLKMRINDIASHIKEQEVFQTTIQEYMYRAKQKSFSNNTFKRSDQVKVYLA